MKLEQPFFLFVVPRFLVDCRIEVVIPSFSALFTCSLTNGVVFFKFLSNFGPVVEAEFAD